MLSDPNNDNNEVRTLIPILSISNFSKVKWSQCLGTLVHSDTMKLMQCMSNFIMLISEAKDFSSFSALRSNT